MNLEKNPAQGKLQSSDKIAKDAKNISKESWRGCKKILQGSEIIQDCPKNLNEAVKDCLKLWKNSLEPYEILKDFEKNYKYLKKLLKTRKTEVLKDSERPKKFLKGPKVPGS